MNTATTSPSSFTLSEEAFRHEAILYAGLDEFVDSVGSFIRGSLETNEPVLVVVDAHKIASLRDALGADSEQVVFADMAEVGHNPARIIPAWREFVDGYPEDRRVRGVGEPITPSRSADALVECQRHEALVNLAFANGRCWLACPYDTTTLDREVIDEALRTHPFVYEAGNHTESAVARDLSEIAKPFDHPLTDPPAEAASIEFGREELGSLRHFLLDEAATHGLGRDRSDDLVLAVNEIATNSVRHGGGRGVLRIWHSDPMLVCDIRDQGRIEDPLVGRARPAMGAEGGFGLWLANQLCDLVQVRSFPQGSAVRVHMSLGDS